MDKRSKGMWRKKRLYRLICRHDGNSLKQIIVRIKNGSCGEPSLPCTTCGHDNESVNIYNHLPSETSFVDPGPKVTVVASPGVR